MTSKVNALFNFYVIGAEDGENYLAGIIVLAVLLVIALVIKLVCVCQESKETGANKD
jgi:hypothetical protein